MFIDPQLTDVNWNTIILAVVAIIGSAVTSLITGTFAIIMLILNRRQDKKLDKIHVLVNSNLALQLTLNADNARFRANTTNLQADKDAAERAEQLLLEHKGQQAIVDALNTGMIQ